MDDRNNFELSAGPRSQGTALMASGDNAPIRTMTADEFAALGDGWIVYRRMLSGAALKRLFPAAQGAPDSQAFYVLFGAGGAPRFVADSEGPVHEWLDRSGLSVVTRH